MTLNDDLIEAARWGDLEKVKKLLDRGADVNARDKDGWTPLHWASVHGHLDVIKLLVERGADVNASNHGWTPLHEAASRGHLNVVKFLVERGADVNARDREGRTPLDLARREMYWNVADFLEKAAKDRSEASKTLVTPVVKSEEPEKSSPILDLSKYLQNPQKTEQYLNELYRAMLIVKRRGKAVIEENEISSLIDSIKAALDKIGYNVYISRDNSVMGSIELSGELMSVLGIKDGDAIIVNSILKLVAKKGDLKYNSVRIHEEDAEVVVGPMIVKGKDRLEGVVLSFKKVEEKPIKSEDEEEEMLRILLSE